MSINGNTACACADCGVTPTVTLVQHVIANGQLHYWHLCARCFLKRGVDAQPLARPQSLQPSDPPQAQQLELGA